MTEKNPNPGISDVEAPAENPTGIPAGEDPGEPRAPRSKFPAAGDLFALLGIFLASQVVALLLSIVFGVCALPIGKDAPTLEETGNTLAFNTFVADLLAIGGFLLYRRARGARGRVARFSRRGLNPVLLLWGILLMFSVEVVIEPLLSLLPAPPVEMYGAGVWSMLAIVVLAPVLEELMCRGVVLESLRARYGVVAAWLVSSLFFGVIHFYPMLVINAFVLGLVLAFIYIRSESLYASIILHAFNNALGYLFIVSGHSSTLLSDLVEHKALYMTIYVVAAVVCVVSGYMVRRTLAGLKAAEKNGAAA